MFITIFDTVNVSCAECRCLVIVPLYTVEQALPRDLTAHVVQDDADAQKRFPIGGMFLACPVGSSKL